MDDIKIVRGRTRVKITLSLKMCFYIAKIKRILSVVLRNHYQISFHSMALIRMEIYFHISIGYSRVLYKQKEYHSWNANMDLLNETRSPIICGAGGIRNTAITRPFRSFEYKSTKRLPPPPAHIHYMRLMARNSKSSAVDKYTYFTWILYKNSNKYHDSEYLICTLPVVLHVDFSKHTSSWEQFVALIVPAPKTGSREPLEGVVGDLRLSEWEIKGSCGYSGRMGIWLQYSKMFLLINS